MSGTLLALAWTVYTSQCGCLQSQGYLQDFLGDPRLQEFPCIRISKNLLTDETVHGVALINSTWTNFASGVIPSENSEDEACVKVMDRNDLSFWLQNSIFRESDLIMQSSGVAIAIRASRNSLLFLNNEGKVTEIWHPLQLAKPDKRLRVTHIGDLEKGFDLLGHLLSGGPTDFHGQVLRVLYDSYNPYCIVDPETKELVGGIFPEILETVAEKFNLTLEYEK